MNVLITNCAMRARSGTEMATLDLALGLARRGHRLAVLAPLVGPSASILQNHGIIVTDRPEQLPWTPDIIHGHHNHVLAAALASFPHVPAVFVCHTSNYWFDAPLLLSRVRRFCAVDEVCRERVASEVGCAITRVDLLPNAVDLEQFRPRPALPSKPRRALLLAKNVEHVAAVRGAVADLGLDLDEIGPAFGLVVDDLHARLKEYDLVFATARMALEALAVGCAVIVGDGRGLAGLATSSNVDDWHRNNFGLRLLTRRPSRDAIIAEVGRYDPHDSARVSLRIREVASLSAHVDRVETMHREIAAAAQSPADPADDLRALGGFIAQWLRHLGEGVVVENFDALVAANKAAVSSAAAMQAALQHELQQRLALINRLNVDLERARADGQEKDRLIASLHAAAERARVDGQEKDRLIASLHAEAAARLTIIERLDVQLAELSRAELTHARNTGNMIGSLKRLVRSVGSLLRLRSP
jgi:glycosyltransferase involved in cell wall biosynthesis